MSTEESKALVRRWFEEAHNGYWSVEDEVLAPEFVEVKNELKRTEQKFTRERHKKFIQALLDAWPDGHWIIDNIVAEGDEVAVQATFTGTHTASFLNNPPTNKKGRITFLTIVQIADGKIVKLSFGSGIDRYCRALANGTLFKEQEES